MNPFPCLLLLITEWHLCCCRLDWTQMLGAGSLHIWYIIAYQLLSEASTALCKLCLQGVWDEIAPLHPLIHNFTFFQLLNWWFWCIADNFPAISSLSPPLSLLLRRGSAWMHAWKEKLFEEITGWKCAGGHSSHTAKWVRFFKGRPV